MNTILSLLPFSVFSILCLLFFLLRARNYTAKFSLVALTFIAGRELYCSFVFTGEECSAAATAPAFLFAVLSALVLFDKHELREFWRIIAGPFFIYLALTSVSCYLDGCCFGRECTLYEAMPRQETPAFAYCMIKYGKPISLHAVQLYVSGLCVLSAAIFTCFRRSIPPQFSFLVLSVIGLIQFYFQSEAFSITHGFAFFSVAGTVMISFSFCSFKLKFNSGDKFKSNAILLRVFAISAFLLLCFIREQLFTDLLSLVVVVSADCLRVILLSQIGTTRNHVSSEVQKKESYSVS